MVLSDLVGLNVEVLITNQDKIKKFGVIQWFSYRDEEAALSLLDAIANSPFPTVILNYMTELESQIGVSTMTASSTALHPLTLHSQLVALSLTVCHERNTLMLRYPDTKELHA